MGVKSLDFCRVGSNHNNISVNIFTPNPPHYPQVQPLGMTQAAEWKSCLICYTSFIFEKYAPDSMQFLETRSEVKFKVTVTQLYRTVF